LVFAIKRYVKQSNQWVDISLIGEDGYFRGNANSFSTKAEAQRYLELYQSRIGSKLNFYGKPKKVLRLKVFELAPLELIN
jgi:hypothetical protein